MVRFPGLFPVCAALQLSSGFLRREEYFQKLAEQSRQIKENINYQLELFSQLQDRFKAKGSDGPLSPSRSQQTGQASSVSASASFGTPAPQGQTAAALGSPVSAAANLSSSLPTPSGREKLSEIREQQLQLQSRLMQLISKTEAEGGQTTTKVPSSAQKPVSAYANGHQAATPQPVRLRCTLLPDGTIAPDAMPMPSDSQGGSSPPSHHAPPSPVVSNTQYQPSAAMAADSATQGSLHLTATRAVRDMPATDAPPAAAASCPLQPMDAADASSSSVLSQPNQPSPASAAFTSPHTAPQVTQAYSTPVAAPPAGTEHLGPPTPAFTSADVMDDALAAAYPSRGLQAFGPRPARGQGYTVPTGPGAHAHLLPSPGAHGLPSREANVLSAARSDSQCILDALRCDADVLSAISTDKEHVQGGGAEASPGRRSSEGDVSSINTSSLDNLTDDAGLPPNL